MAAFQLAPPVCTHSLLADLLPFLKLHTAPAGTSPSSALSGETTVNFFKIRIFSS